MHDQRQRAQSDDGGGPVAQLRRCSVYFVLESSSPANLLHDGYCVLHHPSKGFAASGVEPYKTETAEAESPGFLQTVLPIGLVRGGKVCRVEEIDALVKAARALVDEHPSSTNLVDADGRPLGSMSAAVLFVRKALKPFEASE